MVDKSVTYRYNYLVKKPRDQQETKQPKRMGRPPKYGQPLVSRVIRLPQDVWEDLNALVEPGDRSEYIVSVLRRSLQRRLREQGKTAAAAAPPAPAPEEEGSNA